MSVSLLSHYTHTSQSVCSCLYRYVHIRLSCSCMICVQALVKLKASKDYSFVKVETGSITSSYNPRTIQGKDVETMVSVSNF